MKNIKPFGPSIGKTRVSKKFIDKINNVFDSRTRNKNFDYSSKLASQIKNEIKLNKNFVNRYLSKEIIKNTKKFLINENVINIKEIKLLDLWIVRQFKGEYNPIHFHKGDISGVGYIKLPKNMTQNKELKNKKIRTNGTIDFINGQKNFLSNSIHNIIPKVGAMYLFPNYLMHTAYPFNIDGERRSFSFNIKLIFKK
tara:strand:- start:440 stop:1030 length:591 start_codon:yes stop_codon:yes gene_type:complete